MHKYSGRGLADMVLNTLFLVFCFLIILTSVISFKYISFNLFTLLANFHPIYTCIGYENLIVLSVTLTLILILPLMSFSILSILKLLLGR